MSVPPRHVIAVTGFVTNAHDEVLLVRDRRRGWELPGGQVEEGEELLLALQRELLEETGCSVEVERLVGAYARVTAPALVVLLFRCAHLDGRPRPTEADVLEAGWFSFEEARRAVARAVVLDRLADAVADREGVVYRTYRLDPYQALTERIV